MITTGQNSPVAFKGPAPWDTFDPENTQNLRIIEEIRKLAKEKNAVILAHNYQLPQVQECADHIGDSLQLARLAQESDADRIVFCGVHFMAESAKILNRAKKVLLPHLAAGCSLADSITADTLEDWKERYPGRAVVTYINSSAEVKALSDVCCTSANAASVVRNIPEEKILFTPDRNLGAWVKKQVPEKDIVVYDGACPTHDILRGPSVDSARQKHQEAVVIAHPECREDVLALADEVCSTSGMIDAVTRHPDAKTFLVATEWGLLYQLKKRFPDKEFIAADGCIGCRLHCPYMKMIDIPDVLRSLQEDVFEIDVPDDVADGALNSLQRMLDIPRDF